MMLRRNPHHPSPPLSLTHTFILNVFYLFILCDPPATSPTVLNMQWNADVLSPQIAILM